MTRRERPHRSSPDEHATLRLDNADRGGAEGGPARVTLVVVTPDGKLEHVLERGKACTIGRADECEVHVAEPSLSRQHARITFSVAGVLLVEDLGSANGTKVGSRTLTAGTTGEIVPGDVLELGTVFVVVDRVGLHGSRIGDRASLAPPRADDMQTPETFERETRTPSTNASHAPPAPSANMDALHALVARVAKSTLSVLILGETGAGKEVLAERVHDMSPRAGRPLLRLNCAALSEQLLESELFGHERGAFTGALQAKVGLLETADTGTIFLDEVGELPLSLQAKLLRVLEDKKVLRVGALKPKAIDVRFVAATNRDLLAEIAAGRFRQDLYFRLNGISLFIPPLRERVREIEPLARRFADAAAKAQGKVNGPTFSPSARAALESHPWPGNVRELKNVIERAVVLTDSDVLEASDLGLTSAAAFPGGRATVGGEGAGPLKTEVDALEQRRILDALAECGGNQTRAARKLGISRGTLVSRLERFGVSRPRKK